MNKQPEQNESAIDPTQRPYLAVIKMMAGVRLSLLNSQNADTAGAEAEPEFQPGDELLGVLGIDEPFVNKLEEFSAAHAPAYAGPASASKCAIPFLAIFACPDGEVETNLIAAPTEIEAAKMAVAQNATSGNEYRAVFSLEPKIFEAMKKFLHHRQPFDIKIM
jgi:hypothetical protein